MPRWSTAISSLVCALAVSLTARAQEGFPIDVEMVRPGLSPYGGFAVDAPHAIAPKTWSAGALLQYTHQPLRLFDDDELVGPLVANRMVIQAHAGISASRRTSFSLVVPVGVHFGAGDADRARNGAGLGDLGLTGRVHIGPWGRFSLGVVGTLFLPTGNTNQYMGERLPRLRAGFLGHTDWPRIKLLTNVLVHVRETVDTGFDFKAGPELHLDVGLQGEAIPHTLDVIAELITRVGLSSGRDGGRLASELVAGLRYTPTPPTRIDLAVGRGLTEGYGTSSVRVMLGFSYVGVPRPKPPEPPPPPEVVDLPELPVEPAPLPEAEPPPPPPDPPAAALVAEEIVFRDPIEFEQGTATLRGSASPVIDAVADVILENGAVGHVVIEGHASQEGGYAYNYALSQDRAQAVYEALILRGVHPKKLSFRGAGEVERKVDGDTEAARERNRRVVFQVVRQYLPGEPVPDLGTEIQLPWSGEPHRVVVPPPPEPPPAAAPAQESEPEPVEEEGRFEDASFLEEDDALEFEPTGAEPADGAPTPDAPPTDPAPDEETP